MYIVPFFCVVLYCFSSSGAVVAAEWSIEPSISLREEYNDNIHFTASAHAGAWQTSISPSVKLSSKTEISEISGSVQVGFSRFTGGKDLNQSSKSFSLFSSSQSERNTWAMNVSYLQDSTVEGERIATGIAQPAGTQSRTVSVSPSWTRTLTERVLLKLDYGFQNVKFEGGANLNEYTSQRAGGTLQYYLSERDLVGLSVKYSRTGYAPQITEEILSPYYILTTRVDKSELGNVQLGLDHRFSETLLGSVTLGKQSSVSSSALSQVVCVGEYCFPVDSKGESHGASSLFSAKLEKTFEAAKVSGFASRETIPSGSGLVEANRIGVALSKNFTDAVTGTINATLHHTRFISLATPSSRSFSFEPKLNWRFEEQWALDSGYRHMRTEPGAAINALVLNAVFLNLSYSGPKMAISR